jgi:hypothetical protein
MAVHGLYLPRYAESRALIIGINKYQHVGPLIHACNDAKAAADILVKRFDFSEASIDLLIDENATRESILRTFLRYSDAAEIEPNDRILIFFAGHGHTVSGRYREIGYLVPVDGKVDDLSTLIRWDDLTQGQSFIKIQGDWVIPDDDAPTTNKWYYCASWIGIDGDGSSDVCQAGVEWRSLSDRELHFAQHLPLV